VERVPEGEILAGVAPAARSIDACGRRQWEKRVSDLPTDVQRRLFEHAASGKSHDAALLKARIARFLHNHKDDWAAR
jgi:hypothetical protein